MNETLDKWFRILERYRACREYKDRGISIVNLQNGISYETRFTTTFVRDASLDFKFVRAIKSCKLTTLTFKGRLQYDYVDASMYGETLEGRKERQVLQVSLNHSLAYIRTVSMIPPLLFGWTVDDSFGDGITRICSDSPHTIDLWTNKSAATISLDARLSKISTITVDHHDRSIPEETIKSIPSDSPESWLKLLDFGELRGADLKVSTEIDGQIIPE